MNRKILIFSVLSFFAFLSGCKDKDDNGPESLDLKSTSFVFNETASEGYVSLFSNAKWRVTWNETWLNCTPAAGEGNFVVTITASPNANPNVRTSTITLTTDGGITKTIQVTQGGLEPFILITPETADVPPLGEDITINVAASYLWSIQIPDEAKDWVQVKSKTESQAVLTVDDNRTGEDRSIDVKFLLNEYNDVMKEIALTQLILPEPSDIEFPDEETIGENITLTGVNLSLIEEIWFGDFKGTIVEGRTDSEMVVTIPATAEEGIFNLKIIYYNGRYEETVGVITLLAPIVPEVELPDEGIIGRNIILTGTNLNLIDKIWFGEVEGVIVGTGRTDESITVTIPATVEEGVTEVSIIYAGSRELNIGEITMRIVPPVVSAFPNVAFVGEGIKLEGSNLDLISKVYFGSIEGSIVSSGRTETSMNVNIPASAELGEKILKVIYLADKELIVGTINLKVLVNLALYAGSSAPNTPRVTSGAASSGRPNYQAFNGIINQETWALVYGDADPVIKGYYSAFTMNNDWNTVNNCHWQALSASRQGEAPPLGDGQVWNKLDYSATEGSSVTFDRIAIMSRNDASTAKYAVEISDDDSNWTKIVEDTSLPNGSSNTPRIHQLSGVVTAKYVRYVVLQTTTGNGNVGLRHFALFNTTGN